MRSSENDRYNAAYFKIPVRWMRAHNRLMKMPMGEWPKPLLTFARSECNKVGFCGEVLAGAVADWLRTRRGFIYRLLRR